MGEENRVPKEVGEEKDAELGLDYFKLRIAQQGQSCPIYLPV